MLREGVVERMDMGSGRGRERTSHTFQHGGDKTQVYIVCSTKRLSARIRILFSICSDTLVLQLIVISESSDPSS